MMCDLTFSLWYVLGVEQIVEQVHCQNWPDLQAPKDTSVLLEMYEMVQDLMVESPGTLLVHCSAGVGRTGAFIGLYKLIKDIENNVKWLICILINDNVKFPRFL